MRGLPGRVLWSVGVFGLGLCSLISYTHISGSVDLPRLLPTVTVRCYMPVAPRWVEDTPTCSPCDPTQLVKSWWIVCGGGVAVYFFYYFQGNRAVVAVVGSSLWALSPEPVQLWSIPTITDTWQTAAHSSSGLSGQSTCVCTARGQVNATHMSSNSCFNPPHCWLVSAHPFCPPLSLWLSEEWNITAHWGWALEMQKKKKTLKLEQRPCVHVHVLARVYCLFTTTVVKARSLNLLYLKTWKEDWLYEGKWKREIGTQQLFVEIATL